MFDRAWIESELEQAFIVRHQIDGVISFLQQMMAQLDGAEQSAAPGDMTLDDLQDTLPEGHKIEGGFEPHEDRIHA